MRAVVLVGGEGTRLRPLTYSTPKSMLPVAELTMIERVVGHLGRHGIDGVVLSMGYQPDAFLAAFPDGTCAGVRIEYAVEPEPLDTAGGIAFAARAAAIDEPFVVVNGDVLSDLDVTELVERHRVTGAEATIALTPVEDPSAFGVVDADRNGRVVAFVEKPPRDQAPSNLINAGFYVFEPSVVERVPRGGRLHLESKVFPALAEAGSLYAVGSHAYWTDTGTPALYLQANLDYAAGLRGVPPVAGAGERAPGVWVLGASVIDGDVRPPSIVGDAVFVGVRARVTGSVLGSGARVEAGAVVERSVLLPGAVVGKGATVERSIVGSGAVVGEGATVAALTVVEGGAVVDAGLTLREARIAV